VDDDFASRMGHHGHALTGAEVRADHDEVMGSDDPQVRLARAGECGGCESAGHENDG
jgi:hypothetical protein